MSSTIKIKRSTTATSIPSGLAAGELAINIPDKRLYSSDGATTFRVGDVELANTNARINLVNTNLTGTNTALRTLISDRLQVANATATYQTKSVERAALANTNASIATQSSRITLVNTNLTGTNTALRTLISDRLQVANATATYQTKTVERAALANTNAYIGTQVSRITLVNTNLTGTNTALRTLISDRLQVANAAATYATKVNPTTSGLLAHTGRATISTNLAVTGNTTLSGTLVANNSTGSAGYYLRTSGSGIYWAPVAGVSTSQYLEVANAVATYAVKASPSTSGFFNHTGRLTVGTNLLVSGNTRITGTTIIDGDLTVEGAVTYVSSSTLNVDDSMIKLSANNSTDTVDVGFYGKYDSSGAKYSGLFRDASDGIYKLYTGLQSEPTSTVNIGGTGYALAQLDAIIDGGTY
jgi:hypothetical protein